MNQFVRFPTTFWSTILDRPDRARQELFTRYRTPVFNFIRNHGFGESDADDLTQEVFLRISREEFLKKADRAKGKFRSLVLAVTRHLLLKEASRRSRHRSVPVEQKDLEESLPVLPPVDEEEQRFNTLWTQNLVGLALERLLRETQVPGPRYYEAVVLVLFQGLSYGEAARLLEVQEGDIRNWLHYGKKKLKAFIIDYVRAYSDSESSLSAELEFLNRFLKLTR